MACLCRYLVEDCRLARVLPTALLNRSSKKLNSLTRSPILTLLSSARQPLLMGMGYVRDRFSWCSWKSSVEETPSCQGESAWKDNHTRVRGHWIPRKAEARTKRLSRKDWGWGRRNGKLRKRGSLLKWRPGARWRRARGTRVFDEHDEVVKREKRIRTATKLWVIESTCLLSQ